MANFLGIKKSDCSFPTCAVASTAPHLPSYFQEMAQLSMMEIDDHQKMEIHSVGPFVLGKTLGTGTTGIDLMIIT